ncbi:MAG: hypothetical protein N2442_13190 [Spirochaetes bacterium]|nr:hypothetical protein [Spirochaetota bacterium]
MTDRTTLEQFKPVAILRSEELETDIVTDPATGELLTTLGTGSVRRWDGSIWKSFESNNNLSASLRPFDRWVFSINKDGTASIWENATGTYWGEMVFLQEGGWIIQRKDGKVLSAPGIEVRKYLKLVPIKRN